MNPVVQLGNQARIASASGQYAESASLYRKAIELLPSSDIEGRVIYHLLAAEAHTDARNYDEAIDDCRCAVAIAPNNSIAWRWLGRTLLDAGRLADAEGALQKSLTLDPTPTACIYLACLCLMERKLGDAERYCRQALALDPNYDEAYFNLGSSLLGQARADEALDAYLAACRIDPDYVEAHREAGAILLDESKYAEAEMHLRKALELSPNDVHAMELMKRLIDARA